MYVFHFATKATINGGQTFPADTYTPSSTGSTTGFLGTRILCLNIDENNFISSQQKGTSSGDTIADPTFVAWNIAQCRDGTQLRLDLTEPNANGVVIAADIYVLGSQKHTFFSFRNKGNLAVGFTVEMFTDYTVRLYRDPVNGTWANQAQTTAKLNSSKFDLFFV